MVLESSSSSKFDSPLLHQRPAPFATFPFSPLNANLVTRVINPKTYSFFGKFDQDFLIQSIRDFLCSNTDADGPAVSKRLSNFFAVVYGDCTRAVSPDVAPTIGQACWVVIRMGRATDEYVTPRWHQDGQMFDCSCTGPMIVHSKYAMTLLGPATLILGSSDLAETAFKSVEYPWRDEKRDELAAKLADFDRVPLRTGDIIRFSWGQEDSPIHSEPDSSMGDRIFMSILFGSEEEIRLMCDDRGEDYGTVDI